MFLVVIAGLLLSPAGAQADDIAVIVHPSTEIEGLSFADLRKILLGDRQLWPSGEPITRIVRAAVAEERSFLLDSIYEMSERQYRQYWIAKIFRAEVTDEPRVVVSNKDIVELVGLIPGAIALVLAEDVPAGLKVIKIDGLGPGDSDYALHVAN